MISGDKLGDQLFEMFWSLACRSSVSCGWENFRRSDVLAPWLHSTCLVLKDCGSSSLHESFLPFSSVFLLLNKNHHGSMRFLPFPSKPKNKKAHHHKKQCVLWQGLFFFWSKEFGALVLWDGKGWTEYQRN